MKGKGELVVDYGVCSTSTSVNKSKVIMATNTHAMLQEVVKLLYFRFHVYTMLCYITPVCGLTEILLQMYSVIHTLCKIVIEKVIFFVNREFI